MKRFVFLLIFCLTLPAPAQDQVIATSGGYRLTVSDLKPALEVLTFLAQSELNQQDVQLIVEEARVEFHEGPAALMQSLTELNTAISTARATNDPLVLGEFRQLMIAEFYKMALETPRHEMPAFLTVLFRKAPVVAYDPQTGVALTQPDLQASLAYLQALNAQRGEAISDYQMRQAAEEIKSGFGQLDPETQKLMASGSVLLSIYQSNMQSMSPRQQQNVTSHYRTTTGGPPRQTRGGQELAAARALSKEGLSNHNQMMSSLKAAGGSDNYWELNPNF